MDLSHADLELSITQTKLIVRGMLLVAKVDGLKPQEVALMKQFYLSDDEPLQDFDAFIEDHADVDKHALAAACSDAGFAEVFASSLVLAAIADGGYSGKERKEVGRLAQLAGISTEWLNQIQEDVIEQAIGQFAGIANNESLLKVARDLDPAG